MTDTVIAASRLTKRFGKVLALDAVDLSVPRGATLGLLGPTGAGKSTLIRLLAGIVHPTSGTLTLDGAAAGSVRSRRHLGVALQDGRLYDWMTAREVLAFAADVAGVPNDAMPARIDAVAGQLRLVDALDHRVTALDAAVLRRLSIAQAVVADPQVLLLDEPAQALEPDGRREVLGFLATLRGRITLVIATRRFADVDALCDRVALLAGGRIALEAPIAELRRRLPSRYVIETSSLGGLALEGVVARLRAEPWVSDVSMTSGTLRVTVSDDDRAGRELVPAVVSAGVHVAGFRHEQGSVEQLVAKGPPE